MPTFTITEVEGQRPWSMDGKDYIAYKVQFEGDTARGEAEISKMTTTAPPSPPETIEADLIPGKGSFPPKLKKTGKPGGYSNGGGNGKAKGDYRTPEQIMRGYAQMDALKYWELKHSADPSFVISSWSDFTKIVDLFYADAKAAS